MMVLAVCIAVQCITWDEAESQEWQEYGRWSRDDKTCRWWQFNWKPVQVTPARPRNCGNVSRLAQSTTASSAKALHIAIQVIRVYLQKFALLLIYTFLSCYNLVVTTDAVTAQQQVMLLLSTKISLVKQVTFKPILKTVSGGLLNTIPGSEFQTASAKRC